MGAVSCYLVHYGAPDWCRSSVASLLASDGVTPRVFVVDNGGWVGPEPEGAGLLPQPENRGFTGGANAALRHWWPTGEEFVLIGAHDLHLERGALGLMLEAAQSAPRYGVLAPAMRDTAVGSPHPGPGSDGAIQPRAWVAGACMLIRRGLIEEVGGFDEIFGSYTEDRDLCRRARQAGWEVGVVSDAIGWGLGKSAKQAFVLQFTNGVVFDVKHRGRWAAFKAWIWLLLAATTEAARSLRSGIGSEERRRLRRRALDRLRAFFRVPDRVVELRRSKGETVPRFQVLP